MSTNLHLLDARRETDAAHASDVPPVSELAEGELSDLLFAYGMFFARSGGHRMPGWSSTCARGACAGIVAVATATTLAPVDLTPVPSCREVDGVRVPSVIFTRSAGRILYTPPTGWKLQGGRGRLTLLPRDVTAQSEGSITVEMAAPAVALDETTIQEQVDSLTRRLPRDAMATEVLAVARSPLKIDGCENFNVSFRYQLFGQAFRSQTILLPAGSELWRLGFTARDRQFDHAYEPFRQSLYSLEGIAER